MCNWRERYNNTFAEPQGYNTDNNDGDAIDDNASDNGDGMTGDDLDHDGDNATGDDVDQS